jgi:hypothetical protein
MAPNQKRSLIHWKTLLHWTLVAAPSQKLSLIHVFCFFRLFVYYCFVITFLFLFDLSLIHLKPLEWALLVEQTWGQKLVQMWEQLWEQKLDQSAHGAGTLADATSEPSNSPASHGCRPCPIDSAQSKSLSWHWLRHHALKNLYPQTWLCIWPAPTCNAHLGCRHLAHQSDGLL